MKCVYSIVLLLLGGLIMSAQAQNQKFGYIDSNYIMSKMPDYKGIEQKLNTQVQTWTTEITKMEKDIDELKRDLLAKEILYTEQIRKQKQDEIKQKETEKDRFIQSKYGPDGEFYKTQATLLEPIQQKIMLAVRTVAERGKYDFVFDRSGDFMFFYSNPQWNLSDNVLEELGIAVEQTQ